MISVTILTKNNSATIHETLESVKTFPEVLVVDTGSSDDTLDIVRSYDNTRIEYHPFVGFGSLRNIAARYALHDWILVLDADETLPVDTLSEITTLSLHQQIIYGFRRKNFFHNKWIRGCGWDPDRVYRLYNKQIHSWTDQQQVHETLVRDGVDCRLLNGYITHRPYLSCTDFLNKMQLYSDLYVKQHEQTKTASIFSPFLRGCWTFFKCYFLQRGVLLGWEGWVISCYNAHACHYKYLKLYEKQKKSNE